MSSLTGLETIMENLICFTSGNTETRGPRTANEFGQTSFPKSSKEMDHYEWDISDKVKLKAQFRV